MRWVVKRALLRSLSLPILRNVRFAFLRRLTPLKHGGPNGTPVVRYYWAEFLKAHRADIRGRALEIGTTDTIREYGGSAITQAEALDLAAHSRDVTVVADLSRADHVPADTYDRFLIQFVTCTVYDVDAAVYHAIRILKPGGVLLINYWCLDYYLHRGLDMGTGGILYMHHWFTPIGVADHLHRLGLKEQDYSLNIYGNILTRFAFKVNLPAEELSRRELNYQDPGHPLLICARIVKPADWSPTKPLYRDPAWLPSEPAHSYHPTRGHQSETYAR